MIVKIRNIVAHSTCNTKISLAEMYEKYRDTIQLKFNPWSFAGMTTKVNGHKVLLFSNGKIVFLGAKSKEDLDQAVTECEKFLQEHGLSTDGNPKWKIEPITIDNIVAEIDVEKQVELERFAKDTGAVYEPFTFPDALVRLDKSVTMKVFSTGKIICAGCRTFEQLKSVVDSFDLGRWLV